MPGDCCECGACCFSQSDSYVPVTEADITRLGEGASALTARVEGQLYLRMKDGHCAALEHMEGDWVCGIYALRPEACRQLKRGSPDCLAERTLKRRLAISTSRHMLRLATDDEPSPS